MIHDSTPHHTFKITKRTRLIASQLVLISRKAAANLACVCWSLEEPIFSILCTLLEVLSEETWEFQRPRFNNPVVCGLDPLLGGLKA